MRVLDIILVFVALLAHCVLLVYLMTSQLHMFQLNSYRADRYSKWAKGNYRKNNTVWCIFPIVATCLILNARFLAFTALYVVTLVLLVIFTPKAPQKKKFVVTARVKRQYAVIVLIIAVFFEALKLAVKADRPFWIFVLFAVATILLICRYIYVYIIYAVTSPVEKAISKHYINDAKKKLTQAKGITVIGITGSYGKTSTKYILNRILSEKFNVLMTPESFNTPMGITRTIRENLQPSHEIFIAEMGAKQIGDIKEICDIVNPTHCIITSVGPCHLESFKTIENVRNTKLELFEASSGLRLVNMDSKPLKEAKYDKPYISYGTDDNYKYYASNIKCDSLGMSFLLHTPNGEIELQTQLLGSSNALNITAAAALACELGVSHSQIKYAVSLLKAVPHRLSLNANGNYVVLDDAYNSNPAGAKEAVNVLKSFEGFYRILITPGMVELGDREYELNEQFGVDAADCADYVIAVGTNRSKPIVSGLEKSGFDKENISVAKNLKEALTILDKLKQGKKTVVLFENDLPDNYEG